VFLAHDSSVLQRRRTVRRDFGERIGMEHKTIKWCPEIGDSNGFGKEDVVVEICKLKESHKMYRGIRFAS